MYKVTSQMYIKPSSLNYFVEWKISLKLIICIYLNDNLYNFSFATKCFKESFEIFIYIKKKVPQGVHLKCGWISGN